MERILVTGSTGFIGSHLIEKIHNKYNIIGISKNDKKNNLKISNKKLDLSKVDKIKINGKINKIIHTAGYSDVDFCDKNPKKCFELNINSMYKVLELAREKKADLIFLSSSHIYGNQKKNPAKENNVPNPNNFYGLGKKICETICESYSREYNLNVKVLRIFSAYGPRSKNSNLVQRIIIQSIKSDSIELGNISSSRDFIYVSDVIDAIIALFNSKNSKFEIYNIGRGKPIKIKDLISQYKKISKKKLKIISNEKKIRKNDVKKISADISRIQKRTGWKPRISLKKGLEMTYNYYL